MRPTFAIVKRCKWWDISNYIDKFIAKATNRKIVYVKRKKKKSF